MPTPTQVDLEDLKRDIQLFYPYVRELKKQRYSFVGLCPLHKHLVHLESDRSSCD